MEFIDLSRYMSIKEKQTIWPFAELRKMKPIRLTNSLELIRDEENLSYAQELAEKGCKIVRIQRVAGNKYLNRTDYPRRVLLEMTSHCNYLCRMCPQHSMKRERMDMDGEMYRKMLKQINDYGVEGIWLYHLGESIMHPEYKQIINSLEELNNLGDIWISTNGRLFTENYARLILNSKVSYINYSMHAVSESVYDTIAPPGNFIYVKQNLETLYTQKGLPQVGKKPYIHVQMIEQETTKNEVDAFINQHHEHADIVSINMLEYIHQENNRFGVKQRERKPKKSCLRVSRNDCFIFSNGDVTLCDYAINAEIKLGNIYENTLYEIWNGSERKKILELNERGRICEIDICKNCTDYDI